MQTGALIISLAGRFSLLQSLSLSLSLPVFPLSLFPLSVSLDRRRARWFRRPQSGLMRRESPSRDRVSLPANDIAADYDGSANRPATSDEFSEDAIFRQMEYRGLSTTVV